MTRRWNSMVRKTAPILTAGFLLQAGGCSFDPNSIAQGLLTAIANSLVSNLVFGIFNIPVSGF